MHELMHGEIKFVLLIFLIVSLKLMFQILIKYYKFERPVNNKNLQIVPKICLLYF